MTLKHRYRAGQKLGSLRIGPRRNPAPEAVQRAVKIRAAVLEEFARPLVVQELELAEPGPGEVLVRLVACGVCHTDMYTASGADPSGLRARPCSGTRAPAWSRLSARASRWCAPGDHVVTLFSPQCGECVHCLSPRTNLCLAIREQQNLGYLPDGTTRLSRGGEPLRHFMGTSTFAEYTVMPEIALAQGRPRGAARSRLPVRLRPVDRARRGDVHRAGAARARRAWCSAPAWSASARSPAAGCRAPSGSSASTSRRSAWSSPAARAPPTAARRRADAVARILEMTGGFGADYTFEATGIVPVMRQAVEAARMGWGLCTVCGVAGRGETLDVVPRLLITGRRVCGSSFGGVKGRDQVPELVERYLRGDIDVDPFISHRMPLEDVNRGFELMEAQDGIRSVIEL